MSAFCSVGILFFFHIPTDFHTRFIIPLNPFPVNTRTNPSAAEPISPTPIEKAIRFISFQKYGWLFPPVLMNTSDLLQLGVFLSADAFFFRVMLSVP